eukprot:gnl/TRDRNA2_/TRDRNA2_166656_c0_seq2.p1 gnl/TRDRNA2_/TRDRNA2_166656_c0~~gnl/TRDRNA2_/TRDRNA2_166656_c0_seq2.p1  ORF type:complete len:310 (-),score=47.27 gnl/TRDRNA2_/TRDRNA2_166656_c0_seq2:137-1066(-)
MTAPDDDAVQDWEVDPSELELVESIGGGGFATVYLGRWRGKTVAIKRIDVNVAGAQRQKRNLQSFNREVAVMTTVKHINIVRILGVACKEQPLQIITEFCLGGDLYELLHNRVELDLTWTQRVKMCVDIARAMVYLHKFNPMIIHRDLKSPNLLLQSPVNSESDEPLVKVADFGLSRMQDTAMGEGSNGSWGTMTIAAGTYHWMAPEVVTDSRYNEKVDVYSYSIILYEIICREFPFEDLEPLEAMNLMVNGTRPTLELVPKACPEMLTNLMIVCWAHEAKDRPSFENIVSVLRVIAGKIENNAGLVSL